MLGGGGKPKLYALIKCWSYHSNVIIKLIQHTHLFTIFSLLEMAEAESQLESE